MFIWEIILVMFLVGVVYLIFLVISFKSNKEEEAVSAYECGFETKFGSRMNFSYRFFMIAILFIIFDVEISLMLPIPYMMGVVYGEWIFFSFILILILGVLYEYYCGSLKWLK